MSMTSADIANLQTARSGYCAALAKASANPQPQYTVGNRTFNWPEYLQYLRQEIDALDVMINREASGGAWEVRSVGRT